MEAVITCSPLKSLTIKGSTDQAWDYKSEALFFLVEVLQCVHTPVGRNPAERETLGMKNKERIGEKNLIGQ